MALCAAFAVIAPTERPWPRRRRRRHRRLTSPTAEGAGSYSGDVMSDARGSSRSDVRVTVTKTARNTVSVRSDYARIPQRTFRLTRAMDTIQNTSGTEVFLFDIAKTPNTLMLTIDDAAWSGVGNNALGVRNRRG